MCQTNPVGVKLFSRVKDSICIAADEIDENALYQNIANSENVAPAIFFVPDPVQMSNVSLPNQSLQLSRTKKSDISKLDRTMN